MERQYNGLQHSGGRDKETRLSRILCAGLNAHGQLDSSNITDIRSFRPLQGLSINHEVVGVLFSGWSNTILRTQAGLTSLGFQQLINGQDILFNGTAGLHSAFGDHNGLIGFLTTRGHLVVAAGADEPLDAQTAHLQSLTTDSSPKIAQIALTATGRIALTFVQAFNGLLCHCVEFASVPSFLAWYRDPTDPTHYPEKHHMLPGRPKQLLAGTATFLLLTEGGELYNWGDPRYRSLGREIVGEGSSPADAPAVVEAMGGLKIARIAAGGWLSAAVSEDGALYLWGAARAPGAEHSIRCLREAGAGEVVLVELPGVDGEPADVADVAVGDAHVAATTVGEDGNRLLVVGDNRHGQLGLGSDAEFIEDWTEVLSLPAIQNIICGPKSTFISTTAPLLPT